MLSVASPTAGGRRCPHIHGDVNALRQRFCLALHQGDAGSGGGDRTAKKSSGKGKSSLKSKKPADVSCAKCAVSHPNVWACVEPSCGFRGCGRYQNGHFLAHHNESRPGGTLDLKRKNSIKERSPSVAFHSVCVNTATGVVWCYECDCEVEDENDGSPPEPVPVLSGRHLRTASVGSARSTTASGDGTKAAGGDSGNANGEDADDNASVASSSVSSMSPRDNRRGVCGLANLGNTCYMNAALQALSNCHPLTQYFLDCQQLLRHVAPGNALVDSYSSLLSTIWGGKFETAVPTAVVREVRTLSPVFRGYGQQDSQEFLRFVLDKIGEGLKQTAIRPELFAANREGCPNGPNDEKGEKGEKGEGKGNATSPQTQRGDDKGTYHSIISDVFEGVLRSEVTCFNCGKTSIKDDAFLDLSVPIPSRKRKSSQSGGDSGSTDALARDHTSGGRQAGDATAKKQKGNSGLFGYFGNWLGFGSGKAVTLEQCIGAFTATEELTGDDRYRCEHCKTHTDSSKRFRILSLPEILCVHIKRFRYDSYFSSKISHKVAFPLRNFDMAPFVMPHADANAHAHAHSHTSNGHSGKHSDRRASADNNARDPDASSSESGCTAEGKGNSFYSFPRPKAMQRGTNYDLVAIINHRGGIGGGHYVCYAKNCVDNKWHEFDDGHVTEVDESYVAEVEAYVLFYQRKPTESSHKEKKRIWRLIDEHANPTPSSSTNPTQQPSADRYYVSRQWMSRWGTCSDPGPIDGFDIFCKHGGVRPALVHAVKDFVLEIPASAWHRLVDAHGGGPAVTKLVKCVVCETDAEQIAKRRQYESARISELDRTDGHGGWYLISAQWLNEWHAFKNSKDPNHRPPGPVRNTDMLQADGQPKPKLRAALHYRGIGKEVWEFFVQVYGGGPSIRRANIDIYLPPLSDSER
eukprot:Opistho-2@34864